eukprot:7380676-Prymnesium_polylepis.1
MRVCVALGATLVGFFFVDTRPFDGRPEALRCSKRKVELPRAARDTEPRREVYRRRQLRVHAVCGLQEGQRGKIVVALGVEPADVRTMVAVGPLAKERLLGQGVDRLEFGTVVEAVLDRE